MADNDGTVYVGCDIMRLHAWVGSDNGVTGYVG